MEKGVPRHLITHDGTPLTEVILGAAVVPPRTSTKDVWVWDAIVGRMKNSTTLIPPELEREWIERGYLPDHRNIRTWTKLDVEVAGEHIPCTGARWGSTQILVPQEWIKKELRFVGGFEDAYKPARKGLVVSQSTPEAQYYMEAWGAIVHAIHTGIVDLNLNLTNHGWYSQYLNEVAGNRLEPYSFNKTDNGIVEIGKVDPHLPVTVVYLPSRATQESVKKIPGGHPMAPYGSDSLGKDRTGWAEYYKWEVTGQGGLVIYCSTAINAEGKHMGVAADILTIATPLIYATVEDIKRTGQLESGPHVGQSIRKNLRFRSEWLPELDYPINYFGFPMARK
jgi:hypothetical protein